MIIDQIKKDHIKARKYREKNKAKFLGTLLGEIETEVKRGKELTDALVIAKIKKTLKGLDEILSLEPKALACLEEKAVLSTYLPAQMSSEAIKEEIGLLIKDKPNVKLGDVMKYFKNLHEGLYDPKTVTKIFQEVCGGKAG